MIGVTMTKTGPGRGGAVGRSRCVLQLLEDCYLPPFNGATCGALLSPCSCKPSRPFFHHDSLPCNADHPGAVAAGRGQPPLPTTLNAPVGAPPGSTSPPSEADRALLAPWSCAGDQRHQHPHHAGGQRIWRGRLAAAGHAACQEDLRGGCPHLQRKTAWLPFQVRGAVPKWCASDAS